MITKESISLYIEPGPAPENLKITAEQTTRLHWLVGKTEFTGYGQETVKLDCSRKVWGKIYGDIREELITVLNDLRGVPAPDCKVIDAMSRIDELLGKLNYPHPDKP